MTTARAIAFTQFVIISLGAFVLHLLVKIQGGASHPDFIAGLAQFIARHALWLFAVPIIYGGVAAAMGNKANERPLQIIGFVLTAILVLSLGIPIIFHLL